MPVRILSIPGLVLLICILAISSIDALAKCSKGEPIIRVVIDGEQMQARLQVFFKQLESQVERAMKRAGCVQLVEIPADARSRSGAAFQALKDKKAEMVIAGLHQASVAVPAIGWLTTPFAFRDLRAADAFLNKSGKVLLTKSVSSQNLKLLSLVPLPFDQIAARKRITFPKDATGQKFRSSGQSRAHQYVTQVKATHRLVPDSKLSEALSGGALDAYVAPWQEIVRIRAVEVLPKLLEANHLLNGVILVGSDTWSDGLKPEVRDKLQKQITASIEQFANGVRQQDREAKQSLLSSKGEMFALTNYQRLFWWAEMKPLREELEGLPVARELELAIKVANY